MAHNRRFKARYGAEAIAIVAAILWTAWICRSTGQQGAAPPAAGAFLIDNFSSGAAQSPLGTNWVFLPPQGGRAASSSSTASEQYEQRTCLRIARADANDSNLVEALLYLHPQRRNFDARAYRGVRLTVKGSGGPCAVRLRTKDTRFPKQYYEAEFRPGNQWRQIELPFPRFAPISLAQPLDLAGLRSIAVVVKPPGADIHIDDIAFYQEQKMYRELTPEERRVILHKGTEAPFSGKYNDHFEKGAYTCRQCGAELFESSSKFKSECGWPSFDEQIPGAVKWQPDADGRRTEILCANCGGHLGHVFLGERLTDKNTRYCVNSISMDFVPAEQRQAKLKTERALFASGCFWGTEYHFQRALGVLSTTVGYTGGHVDNPTYKQVSTGRTGHAETTEVIYDPTKTSYEQLAKLFFETHDFTQLNRQGPDIGTQYRSAIFYLNDQQKQIAEQLVQTLRQKGYDVKTEITPARTFWPAEDYHQDYYNNNGKTPYCHIYRRIF